MRRTRLNWILAYCAMILVSCVHLGKDDSTVEEKFYEVDRMTIASLYTARDILNEFGNDLKPVHKTALRETFKSLRMVREETRGWVDACVKEGGKCDKDEKIQLGIDSIKALVKLLDQIIKEVQDDE